MKDLVVVIPTRGRVGRQTTFAGLPAEWRRRTIFVCPEKEVAAHAGNHPQAEAVVVQPDPGWTIARKRRWIVQELCATQKWDKIVMMDDDLRFCVRREDDPRKFLTATPEQVGEALTNLEMKLSPDICHAGFAARGGGISPRAMQGGWQEAKRMMYVLGYHVPSMLSHCDPFRIETREDMDICLQLLRGGYPNAVNYSFVVDQKFGVAGGASLERDFERADRDAEKLAELHPGLVKVVRKSDAGHSQLTDKRATTRLEVVCQWEAALREGRQRRAAESGGAEDRTRGKGAGRIHARAR